MPQLSFLWPFEESLAPEDYLVSGCNEEAASFLDTWPGEQPSLVLLTGPEASGKTHLAARWRARTQAISIDARQLGTMASAGLWRNARLAVLEDIHDVRREPALFHLLRHAEAHRLSLLMTSRVPARRLPFELPDLRSRLFALHALRIDSPDEALLAGYLMKSFADRQWRVEEGVTAYLAPRLERSFAAARSLVTQLEKTVARERREITIPLVRGLLGAPDA